VNHLSSQSAIHAASTYQSRTIVIDVIFFRLLWLAFRRRKKVVLFPFVELVNKKKRKSIENKLQKGNLKIRLGPEGYKQYVFDCNAKNKARLEARLEAMLEAEAVETAAEELGQPAIVKQVIRTIPMAEVAVTVTTNSMVDSDNE
jgi:hypothetical protein